MNNSMAGAVRPVPVPVLAALALVAALLVGSSAGDDHAHAETGAHAAPAVGAMNASQVRYHDRMRKLWEDHIAWTRMAIVAFSDGSDGFPAAAERLMRNQVAIGNAIEPFYGERAGDRLTALLQDHIAVAVEVLQAAKAGDTAAFEDANARWYANGDDVADFISSLDRAHWPRAVVRDMMRMHLDQTLAEAAAELGGRYRASVRSYNEIHHHILAMADALSGGIMAEFPGRFR